VVAFGWAVAEAVVWPLMPEAVLVPLAAARPRGWWQLAMAAELGSALGGAGSYAIGCTPRTGWWLAHLPLVRPAMVDAARDWLREEGGGGVLHQPLSGVPVKVFALVAASSGVRLPTFLVWATIARGARLFLVCAASALVGKMLRRSIERRPRLFLAAWIAAFGVGLWRMELSWKQRGTATR
jgi:membrane protein YqaA with SNARE-associated domain